jgi:hypothetical protein
MVDFEVAILESLYALGGRATIQDIYNKLLRKHVTKLQQSGEIARVKRGTYRLTPKGRRRIGTELHTTTESCRSGVNSIEYYVDNEFGGIVVGHVDKMRISREPERVPKISPSRPRVKPMAVCPACRVAVRADRLKKHLGKVHPGWKGSVANLNTESESVSADRDAESPEEELNQSHHESRFGEKYLGQMRRDYDGTFGSIPLYDDYGDESGPD